MITTTDIEMMHNGGPQFNVTGWYTVDLGSPSADVVDFVFKDFVDSEFFAGDLLCFPAAPREAYVAKDVEEIFDAFGRCIF